MTSPPTAAATSRRSCGTTCRATCGSGRCGDGTLTMGMTDAGPDAGSGKVLHIQFKKVGRQLEAGQSAATIETAKWAGPFPTPVAGTIVATNADAFRGRHPGRQPRPLRRRLARPPRARRLGTRGAGLVTGQEAVARYEAAHRGARPQLLPLRRLRQRAHERDAHPAARPGRRCRPCARRRSTTPSAMRMSRGSPDTIMLVSPDAPYVSIGRHQDVEREVDRAYCARARLPGHPARDRRRRGLPRRQPAVHPVDLPGRSPAGDRRGSLQPLRRRPSSGRTGRWASRPTYRPINDIHVNGRKIGGTGAARMDRAEVVVGSLMFDFDVATMARVLRVPSEKFRDKVLQSLTTT